MLNSKEIVINYKFVPRNSKFWRLWLKIFPGTNMEKVCIAFGKVISIPNSMKTLSQDLIVHELTHLTRQKNSYFWAIIWWIKYYYSPKFRYQEELLAYQAQLMFLSRTIKDRNTKAKIKFNMANLLSSNMYGNLVTQQQALKDLK